MESRRWIPLLVAPLLAAACARAPRPNKAEADAKAMNPALALAAERAVARFDAPVIALDELRGGLAGTDPLLVDTRRAEEFAVSRIPGAVSWDREAQRPPPLELRNADAENRPVVFYCSIGWRSGDAAQTWLADHPNAAAWNLTGGIFGWAETGGELEGGDKVHPFDATWGLLLAEELRAP